MRDSSVGHTKHGDISIDKLAEIQPGMARIMDEIAKRHHYTYYAARGGNWKLALHELNELRAAIKVAKVTRPKFTPDLTEFENKYVEPIARAVRAQNWSMFERGFVKATEASDKYHDKHGYGYVRFVLPEEPPKHLFLGRVEKFRRSWKRRR